MVGTIGSVGHGADERVRRIWRRLFRFYAAGASLGGLSLGVPIGFMALVLDASERAARVPNTYANVAGILVLAILGLRDLGALSFSLPTRHRQVPMAWKHLPGNWSPFVFGFSLGTGVTTTIYLASFYAVAVVAILSRDFFLAVLMCVTYALARGLLIWVSVHLRSDPDSLIERLAPRTSIIARVNGVATLVTGLTISFGML